MLLYTVLGITAVALLALVVAVISGSVLVGWFTVGASAAGLVLLALNELTQRGRRDADAEPHDEGPPQQAQLEEPTYQEPPPSVAPEPEYREEALRADIWPPDHRVDDDGERVEPRRAIEGDALRPDIWP